MFLVSPNKRANEQKILILENNFSFCRCHFSEIFTPNCIANVPHEFSYYMVSVLSVSCFHASSSSALNLRISIIPCLICVLTMCTFNEKHCRIIYQTRAHNVFLFYLGLFSFYYNHTQPSVYVLSRWLMMQCTSYFMFNCLR